MFSREAKVLASLATLLLCSEIALRMTERTLSIDVDHIRSAPEIRKAIESEGQDLPEEALQVLFMGNSSIREGIAPQILEEEFHQKYGRTVRSYFFYPDGGNVGAWRWAWRRYFMSPQFKPDWVVICGGKSHFDDGLLDPRAAANYFVGAPDTLKYAVTELDEMDSSLEFLASKVSLSYASRMRVQRRLMDYILPYNREVLFDMVTVASSNSSGANPPRRPTDSPVDIFELLEAIRKQGSRTSILLVPNLEWYEIPADLADVYKSGTVLCDLRKVPGIDSSHFFDKAHLDDEGAEILTRALCAKLEIAMATEKSLETQTDKKPNAR